MSSSTNHEFTIYAYDDAGNSSVNSGVDEYKKSSLSVVLTTADDYDSNSPVIHASLDKYGINGFESSEDFTISADGQYSLFVNVSENLKLDYPSSYGDIYIFEKNTGILKPLIKSYDDTDLIGGLSKPSISADGKYIVFECAKSNVVENDTNNQTDVVLFDRTTLEKKIISKSADELGNKYSGNPSISADGRYIVFESRADNLGVIDTNGTRDIYMYDTILDVMTRVSYNINGLQLTSNCYNPCISGNGKVVVYEKYEDYKSSVYAFDIVTNTTTLISKDYSSGTALRGYEPRVNYDGRYIVFYSSETKLVENDLNGKEDVFMYDMQAGTIKIVSVSSDGIKGNNFSYKPKVSADGRYIAFKSYADNLISNDTNLCIDVFVKDMQTGAVQLISKSKTGEQGNRDSSYDESSPQISADGRYVQYASYATNIAQYDFYSYTNKVFIFDRAQDLFSGAQTPDYTVPSGLTAVYNQSLSDIQLPYGFSWEDPIYTKVGNVGSNTFTVTYTPDDLLSYTIVNGIDVVIQVTKATPDFLIPSNLGVNYGSTLADMQLPAGFMWQDILTTSVGNAGTRQFLMTYIPSDTTNYETVTDIAVTVHINKIDPLYTVPTGLEADYMDTLADIILPFGFSWLDDMTTSVGDAGIKQFMATYLPTDTINYNTITNIPISIKVNKLNPLFTVPSGLNAKYGDTLSSVALPSGFAWQDSLTTPVGNTGINQFSVTYTPTDTENYNIIRDISVNVTVSKTVTRIKADISETITEYIYNDTLDLDKLAVTIYYTDNTEDKVNYADFATYGIRVTIPDGVKLTHEAEIIRVLLGSFSDEFALIIKKIPIELNLNAVSGKIYSKDSEVNMDGVSIDIKYSNHTMHSVMWVILKIKA